jgi:hypothetical protein
VRCEFLSSVLLAVSMPDVDVTIVIMFRPLLLLLVIVKTMLENEIKCRDIESHCVNVNTVTFAVVQMLPRGVTVWIGKEFLASKIVTTDLMLLGANTECLNNSI